jgi:membrane-associated phospholipid phosphatase
MYRIVVFVVVWVVVLNATRLYAQMPDSVTQPRRFMWKQWALPATMIGLGIYGTAVDNNIINRQEIREERNEYFAGFSNRTDNYLQFAPIPAVYVLDLLGLKGQHNWQQQTVYLLRSELFMAALLYPAKTFTKTLRPDSSARNSFPSGHTAQAFVAATFFHKEFGKKYPWASVGMFTVATGIGVFRILNNRHWVSDVLAGAGLGILSVELSYLFKPKPANNKHAITLLPNIEPNAIGGTLLVGL